MMPFFSFITSGHLLSFLPKKMNPMSTHVIPDPIGNPVAHDTVDFSFSSLSLKIFLSHVTPLFSDLSHDANNAKFHPAEGLLTTSLSCHSRQAKRDRESSGIISTLAEA